MDEAEAAYRRAIAVERDYIHARVNLGRLYGTHGRFPEALAVMREAEALAPDRQDVLINLGSAWWGVGDTARAAAAYLHALELDPTAREPAQNLQKLRRMGAPR